MLTFTLVSGKGCTVGDFYVTLLETHPTNGKHPMTDDAYLQATRLTASDLKTIAAIPKISELSHLTLPEIEALTDQIAQVVPAGNIPGLILNGLVRLEGRQVSPTEQQR